jgi:hypothetical protein
VLQEDSSRSAIGIFLRELAIIIGLIEYFLKSQTLSAHPGMQYEDE